MSPTLATPVTTVQKTMGAITIRISLMKPSPRGFILAAPDGSMKPNATPKTMPARTHQ